MGGSPTEAPPPPPAPKAKRATPRKAEAAAGPVASPPPAPEPPTRSEKVPPPVLERLVEAATASLEKDGAERVVVLDVASRSSFADRMIVATGLADRQIAAMADHLEDALAEAGLRGRVRAEASPDWVLLDAGDLVVHLFKPEAREAYGLERMWGPDSPPAPDAATAEAAGPDAFAAEGVGNKVEALDPDALPDEDDVESDYEPREEAS